MAKKNEIERAQIENKIIMEWNVKSHRNMLLYKFAPFFQCCAQHKMISTIFSSYASFTTIQIVVDSFSHFFWFFLM